jgi:hypothetical protein
MPGALLWGFLSFSRSLILGKLGKDAAAANIEIFNGLEAVA